MARTHMIFKTEHMKNGNLHIILAREKSWFYALSRIIVFVHFHFHFILFLIFSKQHSLDQDMHKKSRHNVKLPLDSRTMYWTVQPLFHNVNPRCDWV